MTRARRRRSTKASGVKVGKSAIEQTHTPQPLAAVTPKPQGPQLKLPALDDPIPLVERLQTEREQIFKAISIVECCRNAAATLLAVNDPEYMIPAFEAVCDLLDTSAMELGRIVDEYRNPGPGRQDASE